MTSLLLKLKRSLENTPLENTGITSSIRRRGSLHKAVISSRLMNCHTGVSVADESIIFYTMNVLLMLVTLSSIHVNGETQSIHSELWQKLGNWFRTWANLSRSNLCLGLRRGCVRLCRVTDNTDHIWEVPPYSSENGVSLHAGPYSS